jgi:hypothetical protein
VFDDMSLSAIRWAIEQQVSDPSAKLTLILLANCMHAETGKCCPSLKYLAAKSGQSERTVQRNLQRLVDEGFIERIPVFDGTGRQRSNDYKLAYGRQEVDTDVRARATRACDGVNLTPPRRLRRSMRSRFTTGPGGPKTRLGNLVPKYVSKTRSQSA